MARMFAAGFTLIEVLITIVIASILVMLAMPYYNDFMVNTQIRTTAESIANGLRLAQAEAVQRNVQVDFILTPATGWDVQNFATGTSIQQFRLVEGGKTAVVTTIPPAGTRVKFNGLGRVIPGNPDGHTQIDEVRVTSAASAQARELRVQTGHSVVNLSGVRLCNPALPAFPADPQGCP